MKETHSEAKKSYYRRLYVAYLIDYGINTPQAIRDVTGMHKRTLQDLLRSLSNYDIIHESRGGTKATSYRILQWNAINKDWVGRNLKYVADVLGYPSSLVGKGKD